jgi:hypothetical protein
MLPRLLIVGAAITALLVPRAASARHEFQAAHDAYRACARANPLTYLTACADEYAAMKAAERAHN